MRLKPISTNSLQRLALASAVLAFVIHLVLIIVHWNTPQRSDMGIYIAYAQQCVEQDSFYPAMIHLHSRFLFAPGWVNFLVLCIKVFSTWKAAIIANLLMCQLITWCVYLLGKKFFGQRTAFIAVIMWSLLYSNWFVVVPVGTEVPFLCLSLVAFVLCVLRPENVWSYMLAGALLVTANYVRPLSVLFLVTIVAYMLLHRSRPVNYLALLVPMAIGVWFYGSVSARTVGIFAPQSTTSGVNLVMTANDKAYGGVATHLLSDTTTICYVEKEEQYTFTQLDSIHKARAVAWIKEHPGKYAALYVKKLAGMFVEDSWADRPVLGGDGFIGQAATGSANRAALMKRVVHMALGSIVYYVVLVLALIGIVKKRRLILRDYSTLGILILLLFMGIASTCLFSVTPRYHYPFFFIIVLFAAWQISSTGKEQPQS